MVNPGWALLKLLVCDSKQPNEPRNRDNSGGEQTTAAPSNFNVSRLYPILSNSQCSGQPNPFLITTAIPYTLNGTHGAVPHEPAIASNASTGTGYLSLSVALPTSCGFGTVKIMKPLTISISISISISPWAGSRPAMNCP